MSVATATELWRMSATELAQAISSKQASGRYTACPAFYGYVYPVAQRWRETGVICRIHARRITLDAIHA